MAYGKSSPEEFKPMKKEDSLKLIRSYWKWELLTHRLYDSLSVRYKDDDRRESIIKLGKMELGHANVWDRIAGKVHGVSFKASIFFKMEIAFLRILAFFLPFTIFINYMEHKERHAILEYSRLLETYKDDEDITKMITNVIRQEIGHEWHMMEQLADKAAYILKAKEAIHGMTAGILETLGLVIGLLAVHAETLIIGLTGLMAGIGGLIAIMSISYVSAKGHYDLHEGKAKELTIKTEVHPTALKDELENALTGRGIGLETARNVIGAIGDDVAVLSNMIQTIKSGGEAVVPKEAVVTTSTFFIIGTLPILIPFFVGVFWDSGPLIPALVAFVFAIIVISIAGLFIGVLSGQKISVKIIHNILVIAGTCTATYLVGLAARILFGIEAAH